MQDPHMPSYAQQCNTSSPSTPTAITTPQTPTSTPLPSTIPLRRKPHPKALIYRTQKVSHLPNLNLEHEPTSQEELTLMLNAINKVDNNLTLMNSQRIEILPDRQCQLLLTHPPPILLPRHGGRVPTDARVREHDPVHGPAEGRWRVEPVRVPVGVQDRRVERRPRDLLRAPTSS